MYKHTRRPHINIAIRLDIEPVKKPKKNKNNSPNCLLYFVFFPNFERISDVRQLLLKASFKNMLLIIWILLEISLNFTSSTVCPLLPRQLSQTLKCLFHSHSWGLSDKLETFSPPPSSVSLLSHVTKTWGICAWAVVEDDNMADHRQTCQHRLFPPF